VNNTNASTLDKTYYVSMTFREYAGREPPNDNRARAVLNDLAAASDPLWARAPTLRHGSSVH
jgi:hypothetical protein